jgi:hypothetical protein
MQESPVSESEKQKFIDIVKNHRRLVNFYGSKIGKHYPYHDMDKFNPDMMIPYIKGFTRGKDLSEEEYKEFKNAQHKHYTTNAHHPEHWDDNGIPDVRGKMPLDAIQEMVCDWCAMSSVFHNSPYDWADEHIGSRWLFDNKQIKCIYNTLDKVWEKQSKNHIKQTDKTDEVNDSSKSLFNTLLKVFK